MKKYQVIGGQYEFCWHGESDTLRGARMIATKNMEFWDNWQGWHKPNIYLADDVEEVTTNGWITKPDGVITRVPRTEVVPVE